MKRERIEAKTREVKKSNRKYLKIMLLIMIICCVAGFFVGFLAAWTEDSFSLDITGWFVQRGGMLITILLCAADIVLLTVGLPAAIKAHREVVAWDEDDDDRAKDIEKDILKAINISNFLSILTAFLISAGVCMNYEGKDRLMPFIYVYWFIAIIAELWIANRANKDNQLMNPEKHGSVFDLSFNSKQVKSYDEAEQLIIYKASYKAHRAVNITSIVLWVVTFTAAAVGAAGIFPMLCVFVIWLIDIIVFSRELWRLQT